VSGVKARASSGQPVSRREFGAIVQQAVRGRPMSKDEVDLLFRVFDTNKEGLLELSGGFVGWMFGRELGGGVADLGGWAWGCGCGAQGCVCTYAERMSCALRLCPPPPLPLLEMVRIEDHLAEDDAFQQAHYF
jgi:hypothetical protein